jgi:membrane-associated phospholipid phosphatase
MPPELPLTVRMGILLPGITLWLGLYFLKNRFLVVKRPRMVCSTRFDELTPFVPRLFVVYLSTYVYVFLPFLLISDTQLFMRTVYGFVAITAFSSVIHIAFPSQVNRVEDPKNQGLSTALILMSQRLARPYDNFPSTHVAYSVLIVGIGFIYWGAAIGFAFLIWTCLIAISTMMTKQHYLLDVIAGGLIGIAAFLLI